MGLSLKIKENIIWSFLSVLFYKIVLDLSYYFVISNIWRYDKFELHINNLKLIESYSLLIIVFAMMPKSSKKLSDVVIWLLILLSYIPMLTLFAFKDESRIYMYAVTGFWVLIFLLLHMPRISISSLKKTQSKIISYVIFFALAIIVIILIYKYCGISINFNLLKVYDIRSRYVALKIPFAGYVFTWVAYILNPMLFIIFLIRRKWISLTLIIFLQILLFSVIGMKAFLFAIPFVLFLAWIANRGNPLFLMASGFSGIVSLGMISYWLIDDMWISSLFTRRTLLVPAQLSFFYYDFFSKNVHTFLSHHQIFRVFLNYPYHLSPPHLIADVYFNQPQMGANNGIYGDAYMNFGFIGLVLWAILLIIILKLIDSITKNKDIRITVSAIALPVISLTNSALLTCLLTHGLLLSLILLYLLPKERNKII